MTLYDDAFKAFQTAMEEYEASVENLNAVADAAGQGGRTVPLIVRESDSDLRHAVERELAAGNALISTWAAVDAARP